MIDYTGQPFDSFCMNPELSCQFISFLDRETGGKPHNLYFGKRKWSKGEISTLILPLTLSFYL